MKNPPTIPAHIARTARVPWFTLLIAVAALGAHAWPEHASAGAFVGERLALAHGEWWRAWTAHLAHFSWSHALSGASVWLAAAGWMERAHRGSLVALLLLAGPLITVAALAGDAELARYGGLSGVAAAASVWTALDLLRSEHSERSRLVRVAGIALLALILGRIACELAFDPGDALVATFDASAGPVRVARGAHVAGAVCGALLHAARRWRGQIDRGSEERQRTASFRPVKKLPHP